MALRPRKFIGEPEAQDLVIHSGDTVTKLHWTAGDATVRSVTLTPTSHEWAAGVSISFQHLGRVLPPKTWRNRNKKVGPVRNLCIRKIDIEGA